MGTKAFRQFLSDPKIVVAKDTPAPKRASEVFARLVDAAKRSVYADQAKAFAWEVVLVENDRETGNFAVPGGKVAVYSGLLPIAATDGELAGAIGNSVASILSRHGGERFSQSILTQVKQLGSFPPRPISEEYKADPAKAKLQQEEADGIGILLTADAGYDPDEVLRMWVKTFGPGARLDALREHLPEARAHYDASRSSTAPSANFK